MDTDVHGSKLREFALAANSKMKNIHGCTFFIDPLVYYSFFYYTVTSCILKSIMTFRFYKII